MKIQNKNWTRALYCTTAMIFMGGGLGVNAATAQDAAPSAEEDGGTTVVVVGTRASQRSSISRKRNAKTAQDSIIAEDIGVFPDSNVGEAISRIAGVALDRGDFNEGVSVAVRGNSSDLVGVEIDGLGVLENSTAGGLWAGGSGRNKNFQEFPADLIKSVDVVKGSTAATTEGGLGGSIQIKSRTGLDFKEPYMSLRFAESYSSINETWTPNFNFIGSRKFMNDRLGILVNFSQSTVQNDSHATENATSRNAGMFRLLDLDGSAEKTYSLDPALVQHATANNAFANSSAFTTGPFSGQLKTPTTLAAASQAATSKADCYAWFPAVANDPLTTADEANSTASAQRVQELQTCLNQWNDYTPSLQRYLVRRDDEKRTALDIRADYRVSDELTVFGKVAYTRRNVDNHQLTYTRGTVNVNTLNVVTPNYVGFGYADTQTGDTRTRSEIAGSGYYLAPYGGVSQGAAGTTGTITGASRYVNGVVSNIVPGSVVMDDTHHVTKFTISDGVAGMDQIQNTNDWKSLYLSAGGNYNNGKLNVDFIVGQSYAEYSRYDRRMGFSYSYGPADFELMPSGLWNITPSTPYDDQNAALYVVMNRQTAAQTAVPAGGSGTTVSGTGTPPTGMNPLPVAAYTAAQRPWVSPSIGLQYSPKLQESQERTYRLDAQYDTSDFLPFITEVAAGFNIREGQQKAWTGGSYIVQSAINRDPVTGQALAYTDPRYVKPVVVADMTLRPTVRACDDSRYGTTAQGVIPAGAESCNYGYVPFNDLANNHEGVFTLRQSDLVDIIGQVLQDPWNTFYNSYPERGTLFNGWTQIDVEKFYGLLTEYSKKPEYSAGGDPMQYFNFDCLKSCVGSDGQTYEMPHNFAWERNTAAYFMFDFEVNLPLTMRFNGNAGYRYVKTETKGNGQMSFTAIRKTNAFNPGDPNAAAGISSSTIIQQTSLSSETEDWLPSLNLNLWGFSDSLVFRYNWGEVIARPPMARLLPTGTCTFDERRFDNGDDLQCGTIGNPGLKPLESLNQNYSLEWYVNRDSMVSIAYFKNKIVRGGPITVGATGKILAGTGATDAITGESLEDLDFAYTTWTNAPGFSRKGIEVSTKMAFTFLPWNFKYLGFDGNYAKIESSTTKGGYYDLISGAPLPVQGEPGYYYNASIWYDDGKTVARLAIQGRDQVFDNIAANGANTVNNYPNPAEGRIGILPYNPGFPNYTDKTTYVDFKITRRFSKGFEAYWEMRNVTRQQVVQSQGEFNAYSDGTPQILSVVYPGYRITTGIVIRR